MTDSQSTALSSRVKDLTGKTFGALIAVGFAGLNSQYQAKWFCRCECGRIKAINGSALTAGTTRSCGTCRHDFNSEQYNARVKDRIVANVTVTEAECWEWKKATDKDGYAMIAFRGRTQRGSHVSYQLFTGAITDGLWVLHKCDNPGCVNPAHLFLGTHSDNMSDKTRKGRQYRAIGENHQLAKLSQADVDAIRCEYARGVVTQTELGKMYGIRDSQVSRIVNYKSWKNPPLL